MRTHALWLFLALPVASLAIPAATEAQVKEYRVAVHGMVCNQCAYGVEQSLLKTEGVKSVDVDLKNGSVRVYPTESAPITPPLLGQRIEDEGIAVEEIVLLARGRLLNGEDGPRMAIGGSDLAFPLTRAEDASRAIGPSDGVVEFEARLVDWKPEEKKGQASPTLELISVGSPTAQRISLRVTGMECDGCRVRLEKGLSALEGVRSVTVDLKKGLAELFVDEGTDIPDEVLEKIATDRGFSLVAIERGGPAVTRTDQ